MSKISQSVLLLAIVFADLASSMALVPWFPQQQTQTCMALGSICEEFNLLSQCCPGLVCRRALLAGVKVASYEYRCEAETYYGGSLGGVGGLGGIKGTYGGMGGIGGFGQYGVPGGYGVGGTGYGLGGLYRDAPDSGVIYLMSPNHVKTQSEEQAY